MKIGNGSELKHGINVENTRKGMPQQNHLVELGFDDIVRKVRAMLVQANVPEDVKFKLCKK